MVPKEKKKAKVAKSHLVCPYCDTDIAEAAFPYCDACKVEALHCPNCHMIIDRDTLKCPHCGADIKEW
jgi:RNA polymerase subunit RPABC4/transcription elongation factor Spt4